MALRRGFVAVGSNIDPVQSLPQALSLLAERVAVTGLSTFYLTAPLGRPGQPPFANGAVSIATGLGPRQVRTLLAGVEARLGRRRGPDRHSPRTVDLDLVLLGELVQEQGPRLPDPEICERPFVALPLLELAPDLVLPDTGERLADLVDLAVSPGYDPLRPHREVNLALGSPWLKEGGAAAPYGRAGSRGTAGDTSGGGARRVAPGWPLSRRRR